MRLNPKKTVVSRFRTIGPGYGDFTLDGAELEELKSRRIFMVTSKLTFETHLREAVSRAVRSLGVVLVI